jgi:hypothetical protein
MPQLTTITWNLQVERGARAVNWSAKSIFPAFERITRYWNVNFVQVSSVNCRMPIVLTTRTWGKAAMWTSGNRIYVPASFRWASYDLSVAAMVHEIGHVFGGSNHAMAGNLMAANLSDPYHQLLDHRRLVVPCVRMAWQSASVERAKPMATD